MDVELQPKSVLETWPLTRLVPYARNPRKNDHAVDRMVASIREFGFKVPVLARGSDTDRPVAGGRQKSVPLHWEQASLAEDAYFKNRRRLGARTLPTTALQSRQRTR